ncbi:MAG: hypothetical protein LBS72_01195, partial [Oscillospiraceae bacterium]|nr:hypothetical protein [Oscillospiraceae bacterium]
LGCSRAAYFTHISTNGVRVVWRMPCPPFRNGQGKAASLAQGTDLPRRRVKNSSRTAFWEVISARL